MLSVLADADAKDYKTEEKSSSFEKENSVT